MASSARAVSQLASECLVKAADCVRESRSPASAHARQPSRWVRARKRAHTPILGAMQCGAPRVLRDAAPTHGAGLSFCVTENARARQFHLETADTAADGAFDAWRADSTAAPLVVEVRSRLRQRRRPPRPRRASTLAYDAFAGAGAAAAALARRSRLGRRRQRACCIVARAAGALDVCARARRRRGWRLAGNQPARDTCAPAVAV